jgi:hypothetical protein
MGTLFGMYLSMAVICGLLLIMRTQSFHNRVLPKAIGRTLPGGRRTLPCLKMGYIPPEQDPAYRDVVRKTKVKADGSATEEMIQNLLPIPKEGDIVTFPGKWEGEQTLGKIRFLRYSETDKTWMADISPLMDGKSEQVYVVDKKASTFFEPCISLKPVQNYFLRSENGYKISFKKNSTEVVTKANSYKVLEADYKLPTKEINLDTLAEDMETYASLKQRIVLNSLKFGAVGTFIVGLWLGLDAAFPYFVGSTGGAAYLYLLGKKTDEIGSTESVGTLSESLTKKDGLLAKSRFAVPIILVFVLAIKSVLIDGGKIEPFHVLDRETWLPAMGGFLTYRLSLFATEVATELKIDDVLGILPGSVAEGIRLSQKIDASLQDGQEETEVQSTVIFITGPVAAGRSSIAKSISISKKTLRRIKYFTTSPIMAAKEPARLSLVSQSEYEEMKAAGEVVYEGEEKALFGDDLQIFLTKGQLKLEREEAKDTVILLEGPPSVLDSIRPLGTLRLVNIWISLQTKEQFIEKATAMVKGIVKEQEGDRGALAQRSTGIVSDLVNDAAKDITFYMQKAPFFEYTLLNLGEENETVRELQGLLSSVL